MEETKEVNNLLHEADVYYLTGKYSKARVKWKRAIKLIKDETLKEITKKWLDTTKTFVDEDDVIDRVGGIL